MPLRICQAEPAEWADHVRAESDEPAPRDGLAWRATLLLASGDRSALLITAHHATSDGVSLLSLSEQWVSFADRRTRTHWLISEPSETGSLLARCRAEGTTVNAVIVTAPDAAALHLPFSQPALPCLVPVSVRSSTNPPVFELEYGTFIGEFSMSLQESDRELDRWERARHIAERQKRLVRETLAAPTEFEHWPSNEQPGVPTFRRGCLVTDLGRSAPPTEGGPLRLASFRFLVCPRGGTSSCPFA